MFDIFDIDIDAIIRKAADLRRDLASEINELDPARNAAAKHRQLTELHRITNDLRTIADGVIAAALPLGGKPGRALDEAYENLRIAVKAAYADTGEPDRTHLDTIIDHGLTPTVPTDYTRWRPLHWIIEAPDIILGRGGFDACVGNPPFLGGKRVSGALGTNIRDWLVNVLAGRAKGSADQVAYFFLRATSLLAPKGTLGLIATNTIAQGDTREVGLDRMVDAGFTITRAIQSRPWPVSTANLEFAAVWGTYGLVRDDVARISDGEPVKRITPLLEAGGGFEGSPARLAENANVAFTGCYVLGMGYILEPDEAHDWMVKDPKNSQVVFPYLNGEDLNSRPDCTASRWVIDFNDRTLDEARVYPIPFERIQQKVRPERATKKRKVYRENWWQYAEKRPGMRKAIADLGQVLVMAQISRTLRPVFVKPQVFDQKLVVFATDSSAELAVLSSSVHQVWVIKYGSTMRTDPVYTPSDVFETFPRAAATDLLHAIGRILDTERRQMMLRRSIGLTKLYNLINNPNIADAADPDVGRMREIHVELDKAVMEAYGWSDIKLDHGFHTYRQMERWTVSPAARVKILDRLLEENHRRAAAEGSASTPAKAKPKRGKSAAGDEEALF